MYWPLMETPERLIDPHNPPASFFMPGSLSPDFLNEELLDDFAGDPELSSLDGDWSAEYGPSIEYEDPGAIAKRIQEKGRVQLFPTDFVHAAFKMPKSDGGYEDFSFEGRRHILSPYNTQAKRVLLVCARQTEKSTLLGNLALTYSCLVPAFKTLYVSPSAMQTKTFSNDRVKEPIETSPILRAYTTHKLSQNIFEKQFINRSKITLRYAFLNADRVRGIPAWMLLIDEIQDIISDNIPVIEHCLSHAPKEWRRFVYSGTPKSLDNTIEWYRANKSTQGEWMVPCDRCGSNAKGAAGRFWNILGEKNIGNKSLICEKCGEQLHPMHEDAQWGHHVAWHPKYAPFESYRINQLMVPWKDWDELLYEYHNNPRAKFLNESLGISYDSGLRPLTLGQVKNECNPAITMAEKEVKKYRQIGLVNPIFMGIDWGCHDEQTRILTKKGFKYFKDLTDDDEVMQWDPDTREMSLVKPLVRTVRDWDQPLLHFETKGGMDLMVTHTHRMRVGQRQGESWVTEPASETVQRGGNIHFVGHANWRGRDIGAFELPGLPSGPGYSGCAPSLKNGDDWIEFFGYMVTEGGVCLKKNKAGEYAPYCLKMSQRASVNPGNYQKIVDCMRRLDIPFSEFPNPETGDANWAIYGKQYWDWFSKNMGMTGDTKRLPRWMLLLCPRQLKILFDAMVLGDGSIDGRDGCTGGAYYSTSKGLCEDFQEICIKLGLRCSVSLHKPAEGNRKARYRALWSAGRDHQFNTPSTRVKKVPYKGKVYCCAVPTGYIVTERNGKISYQGNTGENTYTVITLGTYVDMKLRVFYVHRCTGDLLEPPKQLAFIKKLVQQFHVRVIGTDYGGGYDRNDDLMRAFGPDRLVKYQYLPSSRHQKVSWQGKLGRFIVARTEVMSDIFNAIKRHQFEFPRWEEFHAGGNAPYASDMLNIYSEYDEQRHQIVYKHAPDKPDDTFHSLLYMTLGSMLIRPRPDIVTPRKEVSGEGRGHPMFDGDYDGTVDQD